MRVLIACLVAFFSPAWVSAAENVASPNLVEGPRLVAINSAGVAGANSGARGASATIYDSFTGAATLTTTTGAPRTYMSAPVTVATGTTVEISEATVYLASTAAQTYSNGLVIRIQLWDDFDGSSASAIFSNPVGGVQTFTVPGPVTLAANTFTSINVTFAAPVILNGQTLGFSINYQGDNGAGPVSVDTLTSLLRAQPEPGTSTLAVGSFQASGTYAGPDWGFYRNVANQTNFNHPNSDRRTFTGLDDIGLALQLRGPSDVAPVVALAPTTLTGGTGSVTPTITTPAQGTGSTQLACSIPATAPSNFTITSNASQTVTSTTVAIGLTCVPQAAATTATLTCTQTATPGPNPADATALITCPGLPNADLSITKTDGVASATPGGNVTYTIVASNAGPDNATGATVADTFPAALTGCSWTCVGTAGGTCSAGPTTGNINDTVNLPAGASVTYTASCTVSSAATGTLSNTATVTAPAGVTDPTAGNNSATDDDTLTASADLSITKTDGVTSATPGGNVTYTIVASNAGPSSATGATVTDTFPAALTGCSWTCAGTGGGTCSAGPTTGNINDTVNLPAGGSVTYTASCTVSSAASGTLSNTATVAAPAGVTDPTAGNNAATDDDTLTPSADLSITKTDGVGTVTAGGSTTYTIVATNAGPSDVASATVVDTFPTSLTCSWTCAGTGGGSCSAGPVAGNINEDANLPSGASVTYTAVCTISGTATGMLDNTATVISYDGIPDPVAGNNSATDSDTILNGASVSGSKTVNGTFNPGGAVTYTIVLNNTGVGAQGDNPGNEFTDVLPAGLTLVSATASSGTAVATVGTNTVTWNGVIAGGGSVTITINATIDANATGTLVNQGTISFDGNGDGTNDGSGVTDDPSVGGAGDGTAFVVVASGTPTDAVAVPGLGWFGLMLLALGFIVLVGWRTRAQRLV